MAMMDVLSLAENVQEIPTLIPASVPAGGAPASATDRHMNGDPLSHDDGEARDGETRRMKGHSASDRTSCPCAEAAYQNGAALGARAQELA